MGVCKSTNLKPEQKGKGKGEKRESLKERVSHDKENKQPMNPDRVSHTYNKSRFSKDTVRSQKYEKPNHFGSVHSYGHYNKRMSDNRDIKGKHVVKKKDERKSDFGNETPFLHEITNKNTNTKKEESGDWLKDMKKKVIAEVTTRREMRKYN